MDNVEKVRWSVTRSPPRPELEARLG